ncbi:succinyl-CoA:3-ketoacid-coenzyme A transferase [Rhodotorula toruloides]|uniref:Succinyl-CoA:3-ketoacid-coenzyme A transferase n=1 Tax=Rhodotorula toruloides TaxID=5286 RepID=A0A511KF43_RHOTO|nr:succinyl-CoA:3-ketoacid-coenzyme A transferase [Rhodotorula toruloides]
MHHPLPEVLETFPRFRDAYDDYCLAPWSCHRTTERELVPLIMQASSKWGMSSTFKIGVEALIDSMKFATVAAEGANQEDRIDLVGQTGFLRQGVIFASGGFKVAFTHSLPVTGMPEGWQCAEPGFREEWARYKQGRSTVARLLRSILSEVNMPSVTPDQPEEAANAPRLLDYTGTRRRRGTLRLLVLLSINVFNYSTSLRPRCLFPSDDLICGVIGNAKLVIYMDLNLANSYYGPEMRAHASPPPPHTMHSLAIPLVLESQIDRQRRHRREKPTTAMLAFTSRRFLTRLPTRAFSTSSARLEVKKSVSKIYPSAEEAVKDVKGDSIVLSGGFGLCGTADTLIGALAKRPEVKNLTCVSNNAGVGKMGLGALLHSGQISKMISSYLGANKHFESLYLTGKVSLELTPQGSLAERCRAGGAGIPAFYTPAGYGTAVQTGEIPIKYKEGGKEVEIPGKPREVREFNGKGYLMEEAIKGDYALVKVWKADEYGNCVFRYAAQNFSGAMARSAKMTIVEAEEIVPVGSLDPNNVHLPGIFVNRVVQSTAPKQIEIEVLREEASSGGSASEAAMGKDESRLRRERIVKRAAKELKEGMYVNLGIGMPMLAPSFLEPGTVIHMQSENGILGMGPYPTKSEVDPDIVNAGKETVTLLPGASTFDSAESFSMIRGGHVDVSMLGAMQVSASGDIANYMIPGKMVKGMGGAMDLVSNPEQTKVVVVMDHVAKGGKHKILDECSLPLTGVNCVSTIITDLCVFQVDRQAKKLILTELAAGVTEEDVRKATGAKYEVSPDLVTMDA